MTSDAQDTSESEEDQARITAREYLSRSLDLLWNGLPAASRGPHRTLTLGRIAETAIAIADAEGLEALSMRRLARELDVGTMSLYRYVPDKSVLLDLMLDIANSPGAEDPYAAAGSWRGVLEREARSGRSFYLAHPWLLELNWTRPVLGPGSVRTMEALMSRLRDLPLSDREKIMLISLLDGYVVGAVRQQIQYRQSILEAGGDESVLWETQLPYLERAMDTGDYPTLSTMDDDAFDADWDETFEFGLRLLLDGMEREVRADEQ